MKPVTSVINKCAALIEWQTVDDLRTGTLITEYNLEIAKSGGGEKNSDFHRYTDCGAGQKIAECLVPMGALIAPPYNYKVGQLIVARISALDSERTTTEKKAWTMVSDVNTTGALVLGVA